MAMNDEETKIQVSVRDANSNQFTFTISNINEAKIPIGLKDGAASDTTTLLTALDENMQGLAGLLNGTYIDTTLTYRASLSYLLEE